MARFISFESAQIFPVVVADLSPVTRDVTQYFESQGYRVSAKQEDSSRIWLVSLYKGKMFKTVLGMQSALNIELQPTGTSTVAKASLGIFEQRIMPVAVTGFIAWPILLTQIWDLVQKNNLDQEALAVVEQRLIAHSRTVPTGAGFSPPVPSAPVTPPPVTAAAPSTPAAGSGTPGQAQALHCTNCGAELLPSARFCTSCGTPTAPLPA